MDVDAVVEAIEGGHFDGQLAAITQSIRDRATAGNVEMCWRVSFAGMEVTEESLTLAELDGIERMLSTPAKPFSYWQLTPTLSAQHATALLMTCLMHREKYTSERAHDAMKQHTMRAIVKAFTEYEVVNPPKDGTAAGS